MVRNDYSVSIWWVVNTIQCSLPMWLAGISTCISPQILPMPHTQVHPSGLLRRRGWHKPICAFLWTFHESWWTDSCKALRSELDNWISYYCHLRFPDTKVADHALDHFNHDVYELRYCVICPQIHKLIVHCSIEAKSLSNRSGRICKGKPLMKPPKSFQSLRTFEFETLCLSYDVSWCCVTFEVFKPPDPQTQSLWTFGPRDTPRPFLLFSLIPFISLIILFAFYLCLTYIWHILTFDWHLMVPCMLVYILDYASRAILILSSSDPLLGMLCILVHCCAIEHLQIPC